MFHKFTNFIQQAVETFSPNISPQEEFVYHWKSVTSYFVDNKDGGARIEETALPEHLMSVLQIIQEEESEMGEAGTTGVCLEYLLQHRILETLYTLGRTDHPPGMKQTVLSFFTKLLSRINHPLLPHINVHRAVQRLIKSCGETKAGPAEKEEIEFLCTVCAKIKTDPYLVNFFIENPKHTTDRGTRPLQAFSLVDSLLSLSGSEDARVSVKACEGLMLCASLPEKTAAAAIVNHTQFCQTIANILHLLYEKLPALISPDSIESLEAKWGFDDIIERNTKQGFPGRCQVISFLSWLDYCDQLISVANPQVGEALAVEIHKSLLTGHILPQIMQTSESGAIVATAYLTRCLRTVCSPALLREFCIFLLGSDRTLELSNSPDHPLKKRLLERCNHLSEEVCIASLKFFDTLLQKEDEHIFHCLLLRNLLGRSYLREKILADDNTLTKSISNCVIKEPEKFIDLPDPLSVTKRSPPATDVSQVESLASASAISTENQPEIPNSDLKKLGDTNSENTVESSLNTDSNQQPDSFIKNGDSVLQSDDHLRKDLSSEGDRRFGTDSLTGPCIESACHDSASITHKCQSSDLPASSNLPSDIAAPGFVGSEVHTVVNCFLSLLPDNAKSTYQTADSGYDMYLRDAHKQFAIQETVSKDWAWPTKRPVVLAEYVMDTFHEGSFLHMLLDKLLHLLDQSYSVNLLLTGLIARIALVPHPNLHEYLLDPFLPTTEGTRTLYSVLLKVANEIKHHLKSDSTFSQKLLLARKQLLGLVPTIHSLRACKSRIGTEWFEDQSRMEAIIVLEEFCKELSAITFVKHHAVVTRF